MLTWIKWSEATQQIDRCIVGFYRPVNREGRNYPGDIKSPCQLEPSEQAAATQSEFRASLNQVSKLLLIKKTQNTQEVKKNAI